MVMAALKMTYAQLEAANQALLSSVWHWINAMLQEYVIRTLACAVIRTNQMQPLATMACPAPASMLASMEHVQLLVTVFSALSAKTISALQALLVSTPLNVTTELPARLTYASIHTAFIPAVPKFF